MKPTKFLCYGLISLLLVSCVSSKSIHPLTLLTDNNWALSSLTGKGLDMNQFSGGLPSLSFLADGKLAGFSGCNSFSGDFYLEGTEITLDPGAITKKMCTGTGEQEFIAALSKVSELKIEKDKLTLLDEGSEVMSFVPKKY